MAKAPLTARPHQFFIRPAPGWLNILASEVTELLASPLQKYKFAAHPVVLKGAVKVEHCDWRQGLELLLRLTTAHDMEWVMWEGHCGTWAELDRLIERAPWKEVLNPESKSAHITPLISRSFTTDTTRLRESVCRTTGLKHLITGAPLRLRADLHQSNFRLFVSLAGRPLYQRGYKAQLSAVAPLPEHHAAACLRWTLGKIPQLSELETVYVPFAGSGTFAFETHLLLTGAGPGSFSRPYACESFPANPAPTMGFLRRKLSERLNKVGLPHFIVNDFHAESLRTLRENIAAFPSASQMEVLEGDALKLTPKFSTKGQHLILLNPPFGDRLAEESELVSFYAKLGAKVKALNSQCGGRLHGCCLCPDEVTWRSFLSGLGAAKPETQHFTHGGKDMRLVRW